MKVRSDGAAGRSFAGKIVPVAVVLLDVVVVVGFRGQIHDRQFVERRMGYRKGANGLYRRQRLVERQVFLGRERRREEATAPGNPGFAVYQKRSLASVQRPGSDHGPFKGGPVVPPAVDQGSVMCRERTRLGRGRQHEIELAVVVSRIGSQFVAEKEFAIADPSDDRTILDVSERSYYRL